MFISDYPGVDRNPVRSTKGFIKNKSDKRYKIIYENISPEVLKVINNYTNSEYIDLSEFKNFFEDAPFYKDTLMYYDKSHLNKFGSIKYSEYLGIKIVDAIKKAIR